MTESPTIYDSWIVNRDSWSERVTNLRICARWAREGYWHSILHRLPCLFLGHRFDNDPELLHCERGKCGWIKIPPTRFS